MSAKNLDNHNRWRNRQVAFRLSPEEADLLDTYVRLSGLTKQDYITRRLLCREVIVQGNPRVYKALRNECAAVLTELQRIEAGAGVDEELMDNTTYTGNALLLQKKHMGFSIIDSKIVEYYKEHGLDYITYHHAIKTMDRWEHEKELYFSGAQSAGGNNVFASVSAPRPL